MLFKKMIVFEYSLQYTLGQIYRISLTPLIKIKLNYTITRKVNLIQSLEKTISKI